MRKRKQKQKGKKRKKGEKKTRRKKRSSKREKEGKMRKKEREKEDFLAFGQSKFDGSRIKVGACSKIHVWTPKSWSFDKLHEVGYFPT